jgi:hypothetical protein
MEDWVLAHYAAIEGIKAEIEGMRMANLERYLKGESPAYGEKAFIEKAQSLYNISEVIHTQR